MPELTPDVLTAVLSSGVFTLIPLIGLVVIAVRLRGPVQVVGILGCGFLALSGIISIILQVAVPYFTRDFRIVPLLQFLGLGNSVVWMAGIAALIVAVCLGRGGVATGPVRR